MRKSRQGEKKRDYIYIFFHFPIYSRHNLKKSKKIEGQL